MPPVPESLLDVPALPACATAEEEVGRLRLALLVHADGPLADACGPAGYWALSGFDLAEQGQLDELLTDDASEPLDRDDPEPEHALELLAEYLDQFDNFGGELAQLAVKLKRWIAGEDLAVAGSQEGPGRAGDPGR